MASADDRSSFSFGSRARLACAALIATILIANFALVFSRAVGLDDDNTYFYLTGTLLTASAQQHREVLAVDEAIERLPREKGPWQDYEIRRINRLNYLLPTTCYALAQWVVRAVQGDPSSDGYAAYVARSAQLGFCASFAVAAFLLLAAVWRSTNRLWWAAVLLGVAAIGALDLLGLAKTHLVMFDPQEASASEVAVKYLRLMIDPTDGFSMYGFAPRCNLALVMVGVASLRWTGERALGWALFLVAGLYNLYYIPAVGSILLASDLAGARFSPLSRRLRPFAERTIGQRIALDQAVFFLAILATLPPMIVFALFEMDWVCYFTGILHQRVVAAWQPLLIVGGAYALLAATFARRAAPLRRPSPLWLAAAASIALTIPTLARLRDSDSSMRRLLDGAQARGSDVGSQISLKMRYGDQASLYYAQAKSIHLGRDFVWGLLPPSPEGEVARDDAEYRLPW